MSELKRNNLWFWHQSYLEQKRRVKLLEGVLSEISDMCIGDIAMGYQLDANYIGQLIFEATGKTNPELRRNLQETNK